ncbi:hypothetical protein [Deinococcus multiflagellatus]|uniref:DUF3168 domain-containing protein n=1 Tax=Deinococcus multiflagellatus TaxID=1656887 RepID=A0ABW1ZR63_9DEIO|nr:hypothetical protein [Deinococcus multiflagellatus]MBZ9715277.1 hypothetical protein [Deinococcus multiflagellatus]
MLDQITACLRAALPEGVPLLQPRQVLEPADWQETDSDGRPLDEGRSGLQVYFEQRSPLGYVQLYHPQGTFHTGALDLGQLQIDVMAPTLALANPIADQVRRALASTPVQPTPFAFTARQTFEEQDHARLVLTFETRAIGV